jgi:prepilin-type N-terminal cleavage/methylation domain-containing protein
MTADISQPSERQRGFTLVELMVVVAIIALIASIVIPNYVHARAQASVVDSIANMKQIAVALESYYADNQCYPGSSGCAASGATVTPSLFGGSPNNYLNITPVNDMGRQLYEYSDLKTDPDSYRIDDPARYDPSLLNNLVQADGTPCAGSCTFLHYSPTSGTYGSAGAGQ